MTRRLRALLLFTVLAATPAVVVAAPWTTEGLDDYWVTRWDRTGGAPAELVVAMAQDHQGFLWLGSTDGLFRFDGFTFERWNDIRGDALAGTSVRTLFVDHDGALWVGFDEGGVSRIDAAGVRNYSRSDGLPGTSVRTFVQDGAGGIWLGSLSGLYSLAGTTWSTLPPDRGLPRGPVLNALYDSTGSLFIRTPDAIFRRRAGNAAFELIASHPVGSGSVQSLCKDAHGHVVTTDPVLGFRVVEAADAHPSPVTSGFGLRVWCARNGTIWVGTRLKGLWRVAEPAGSHGAVDIRTGLLAQAALSLFEDRDQNLWVGTSSGIYRLTPRNIRTLPDADVATTVTSDHAGRMWIGTADGLLRFDRDGERWKRSAAYLKGEQVRSVHATANGDVWVASAGGVTRLAGGQSPAAPAWGAAFRQVTSITSNAAGTLWIYDERLGLHRVRNGHPEQLALAADLTGVGTTVLHADQRNRLWLVNERAVEIRGDDGDVRRFTTADGLDNARYRSIYEDQSGVVWLGSTSGLSRLIDGRFESVAISGVRRSAWVKTIVEDQQGQLWLGINRGGIRLSRASFQNAFRNSQRLLAGGYEIFDGLPGTIRATGDRGVARTPTGQLWFTTDEGIGVVDPNASLPDLTSVPTRIAMVQADDVRVEPSQAARLRPGTTRVQISWGATDLTTPDRVRFRYRLDGHDRDWVEAGPRREVQYANLAPGSYVFRVAAAREGAAWDEGTGSTWEFTVAPRFYQAFWFPLVAAALLAAASWAVWHIRLVQTRRRFAITLRERARVSREVHDTLLQSLVGVALQCQTMADATEVPAVREKLVRLRHRIDAHIGEARELIWHLRSPTLERNDFITALRHMADDMVEGTSAQVEFRICGRVRSCPPHVERELLRIGQEALSNALRHGRPTLVIIEVQFEATTVRLCVSDDGRGFTPPQTLTAGEGHYGLAMMRERAEEIGGRFSIRSLPDHGASVEATAPLPAPGTA